MCIFKQSSFETWLLSNDYKMVKIEPPSIAGEKPSSCCTSNWLFERTIRKMLSEENISNTKMNNILYELIISTLYRFFYSSNQDEMWFTKRFQWDETVLDALCDQGTFTKLIKKSKCLGLLRCARLLRCWLVASVTLFDRLRETPQMIRIMVKNKSDCD